MKHSIVERADGERVGVLDMTREDHKRQVHEYGEEVALSPGRHHFWHALSIRGKIEVNMTLDADIVEHFEASGRDHNSRQTMKS